MGLPVVAKLAVSALLLAAGIVALSDDDYSRVVIAQQFAHAPRWDPSGTSWLPFPFWLTGLSMMVFSPSLEVARATSILASALALIPLYMAARACGANRVQAGVGTTLAGILPYSVLLGALTPPEGFSSPLVATAMLCLTRANPPPSGNGLLSDVRLLVLGGAALLVATLSRYESWPVALVFAALLLLRALRDRQKMFLLPASLALLGPCGWMLHGALTHGDALFFIGRVRHYQEALGAVPLRDVWSFFRFPLGLLRYEPELMLTLGAWLLLAWRRRFSLTFFNAGLLYPALSLLLFLIASDLGASTATHHAERTLLPLWMLSGVLLVGSVVANWHQLLPRDWAVLLLALGLGGACRAAWTDFGSFAARTEERDIGTRAQKLVPGDQPVAVWTSDYGYFAVMAAFARPGAVNVVDDHDPRRATLASSTHPTSTWWIVEKSLLDGRLPRPSPPERAFPCQASATTGARSQRVAENASFALVRWASPNAVPCLP